MTEPPDKAPPGGDGAQLTHFTADGAAAIAAYADDVRARRFPGPEHVFGDTALKAAK